MSNDKTIKFDFGVVVTHNGGDISTTIMDRWRELEDHLYEKDEMYSAFDTIQEIMFELLLAGVDISAQPHYGILNKVIKTTFIDYKRPQHSQEHMPDGSFGVGGEA